MKKKKVFSLLMAISVLACVLCACGGKADAEGEPEATPAPEESDSVVVEQTDLTEFPADCTLSDDELKNVAAAYGDYISEALKSDGYVVTARFEDDGSVHYDGVRTNEDGTTDSITDLDVFDNLRDCFAYLYNCGQVDLEGNLLVSVSEGVEEQVAEAGDEAEELAQEALDGEEPAEGTVLVNEESTDAADTTDTTDAAETVEAPEATDAPAEGAGE